MSVEAERNREDKELFAPETYGPAGEPEPVQVKRRRSVLDVAAMVLPPILIFAAFIGVWYFITYNLLESDQRFLLPPPHEVVRFGFLDSFTMEDTLAALWSTTQVALVGLLIAIILGMSFAIFMSQARWIERSFYPYAVILQTIPILALVPLIGFWFQFNFRSRVIVCVLIALFPIITNTLFGLQSVDRELNDLFTLHGAGRWTRLKKLQLPHALPAIFTGFRISAGLSVIGAIVGDFFFRQGEPGIGRLLDIYRARLQSPQLITAIIFSSLLGLAVFWLFGFIGHFATKSWHESAGPKQ
jgi:NitT/TauT family transport system permease protein